MRGNGEDLALLGGERPGGLLTGTPDDGDAVRAYHHAVASVFARHHHEPGAALCSCGGAWPCAEEEHAAWLLDWVGD